MSLEWIVFVSFHLLKKNVATSKFEITHMAHLIFISENKVLGIRFENNYV